MIRLHFQLILTSQFPFKLSGKVLQVLVSIFLYHDFSVRNFIKGLQVRGVLNYVSVCRGVCGTMSECVVVHAHVFPHTVSWALTSSCPCPQLALLEHFHSQPLSVLCCKKEEVVGHVAELSQQDVERVRQLPSFRR